MVITETGPDSALGYLKSIYLGTSETTATPRNVLEAAWMPKGWKVSVEGIHTPESANLVRNQTLFADGKDLAPLSHNEYYASTLENFAVLDAETGERVGKFLRVNSAEHARGHDWWIVELENKTTLHIPAVSHFIHSVDKERKQITVQNLAELAERK